MRASVGERVKKPKRRVDRQLLAFITTLPCLVCQHVPSDPDHITSRGAGGDDSAVNVWPLCRTHHTERHSKGVVAMVQKHIVLQIWLEKAGRSDILERAGIEINSEQR